jgi:hypothetical protein
LPHQFSQATITKHALNSFSLNNDEEGKLKYLESYIIWKLFKNFSHDENKQKLL